MNSDTPFCPHCGKPLPPVPQVEGLMGLCPACLLAAGFATATQEADLHAFAPPSTEELASYFPQLEILALLGSGGMGAVYKARQKELDRVVAVKILPPDIGHDRAFAERFTREARALAKLNHPHIVTLYDFGQAEGLFYFFMEYVDGMNLRQLLNTGRISSDEALAIVPQICEALQFAHDQGIVHRDIKPENILLGKDGRVKIADFGVAKIVSGNFEESMFSDATVAPPEATETGRVLGTPRYMAPEQASHPMEVDHRADIYSLGVVFYQMLTGELPGKQIERPSRKVRIDVRLDEVVLRALEQEPERRYQQASIFKTHLETIGSTMHRAIPPKSLIPRRRMRQAGILGLLLVATVTLFLLRPTYSERRLQRPQAEARDTDLPNTSESSKGANKADPGKSAPPLKDHEAPILIKIWPGGTFSVNAEECDLDGLYARLNKLSFEQSKSRKPRPITLDTAKGVDRSEAQIVLEALKAFGINSPEVLAGKPLPPPSHIINPRFQIRGEATHETKNAETFTEANGVDKIRLDKVFLLDEGDIESASPETEADGSRQIRLKFTIGGLRKFGVISNTYNERRIAALFDGQVLTAPVIHGPIYGGSLTIYNKLTETEERALLDTLNHHRAPSPAPTPTPADVATHSPELRALNWQDWVESGKRKSWLPSGAPAPESGWMPSISPIDTSRAIKSATETPRFLCLWFAHPLFDAESVAEVTLLDAEGKSPLKTPSQTNTGLRPADADHPEMGWIVATVSAGSKESIPPAATVSLRYSIGHWEPMDEIDTSPQSSSSIGNGVILSSPGEDANGRAFILITHDYSVARSDEQIDFVAVLLDGRRLTRHGNPRTRYGEVSVERFSFNTPLSQVKSFQGRKRPIRTFTTKVVLKADSATGKNP